MTVIQKGNLATCYNMDEPSGCFVKSNKPVIKTNRASQVSQTVKNPSANAGDSGSIPGSGRSPGEGHGNPLQYSCLKNPTDRGAWWVAKSRTQLSN